MRFAVRVARLVAAAPHDADSHKASLADNCSRLAGARCDDGFTCHCTPRCGNDTAVSAFVEDSVVVLRQTLMFV